MDSLIFVESQKKMPLMNLPVRSTLVPLNDKRILISPGSGLQKTQFIKLDPVTDIVAPNLFHCSGVPKAHSFFEKAKTWGPPSAKNNKSDITWGSELSVETWPYNNELPMIALRGIPKINEIVFIHKASKSLIVTDLCFNMLDISGMGPWIILNLFGTYKKLAISKLFLNFATDRLAFEKSLGEVFSFEFEHIVLSHGNNVIGNAKNLLLQALRERNLNPK